MNKEIWDLLSKKAWEVRENAYLIGKTKVGSALYSSTGSIHTGCNVEHKFRCHDIHAEVNAISSMVASGKEKTIKCILIVAEKQNFTPCGSCMDWIIQHGEKDTLVAFQSSKNGEMTIYRSDQLMPYYPY